ncbi:MAG: hypothetical protein QM769_02880 [Pseudoxanthomonas sp.]
MPVPIGDFCLSTLAVDKPVHQGLAPRIAGWNIKLRRGLGEKNATRTIPFGINDLNVKQS